MSKVPRPSQDRDTDTGLVNIHADILDQNFIVLGNWLLDVRDLDDIRGPVSAVDGGLHLHSLAALDSSGRYSITGTFIPLTSSQKPRPTSKIKIDAK
jgi:hypothetical protein